jgi:hypothetical protein
MTLRVQSMVIRSFLALPFQIRQCSRSTGSTIRAFAATRSGVSSTNPLAANSRVGAASRRGTNPESVALSHRHRSGLNADRNNHR